MMKVFYVLSFFFLNLCASFGQTTFKISNKVPFADLAVSISEKVPFPDLKINFGSKVRFPDFSVAITSNKNEADYIITTTSFPDYKIKTGKAVPFPDLSLKVAEDQAFPDLTIQLKKHGFADYLVYSEQDFISNEEIIVCLLPIISRYIKPENKKLKTLFKEWKKVDLK